MPSTSHQPLNEDSPQCHDLYPSDEEERSVIIAKGGQASSKEEGAGEEGLRALTEQTGGDSRQLTKAEREIQALVWYAIFDVRDPELKSQTLDDLKVVELNEVYVLATDRTHAHACPYLRVSGSTHVCIHLRPTQSRCLLVKTIALSLWHALSVAGLLDKSRNLRFSFFVPLNRHESAQELNRMMNVSFCTSLHVQVHS